MLTKGTEDLLRTYVVEKGDGRGEKKYTND